MKSERSSVQVQTTQGMNACYQRAQSIMQGLRSVTLVQNDNVKSHWIGRSDYFWYLRYFKSLKSANAIEKEYCLVNASERSKEVAFNHASLARSLEKESGEKIYPENLPFDFIGMSIFPRVIRFFAFNKYWLYDDEAKVCRVDKSSNENVEIEGLVSPNGKWIAFTRNYNLWLQDTVSGEELALTSDGEMFNCYAALSGAVGVTFPGLNLQWSPDSNRLFTVQRDSRRVKTWPMVNHVPKNNQVRPTVDYIRVAYPGDVDVEQYRLLSIEVEHGKIVDIDYPRLVAGSDDSGFFTTERRAWWSADSRHAYFIAYQGEAYQVLRVVEVDTDTGTTRILIEEIAKNFVNIRPDYMDLSLHRHLPERNELIWWSQRSGFGHLYLYDLDSGKLKHAITRGDWLVRNILCVDSERRELWIQRAGRVAGRNPYYRDICRVHIDTGELTTLVSTDDEYSVHSVFDMNQPAHASIAPSANYIVATRSRVDKVPVSLLLDRNGVNLMTLEIADVSNLPDGWQWPESVKMKAADGKTDIYGILFRPSHFCEGNEYPVINMIVSGPWFCAVPNGSFHNSRDYADRYYFHGAAVAELGFMVVVIDSRGTPLRDRAFHEVSYGWLPAGANTSDHRRGIEQLAKRYPSMDLSRVGVYSPTGYHGGIQNLLECPDFYQVGVINSLMDSRLASRAVEHSDKYQGVDGPTEDGHFPEQLVENWNGKLLLLHNMCGLNTSAYPPAAAFRVVEAMQRANKDVDMVITPYHDGIMTSYAQRRAWDYLVRHLQGVEPPCEFNLGEFSY